jgi:transposase-like protein/IS1 family transposase
LPCEKDKADVTCKRCNHDTCKRFGYFGKRRIQRWRCNSCNSTFADPNAPKLIENHYTDPTKATQAITLMLEGMSIRAISRVTGLYKQTILDLMNTAAKKARLLLDSKVRNVSPRYVQMDELWGFVHTRDPHLHDSDPDEWGSTMLWLAIDSETKLLISHHVGTRSGVNAHAFVSDLRKRTNGRYQVTSDQYNGYVGAMREYFGRDVDFGQLHKVYGKIRTDNWYGSGQVLGAVPRVKIGRPDWSRISTSHIERANLSVRMHLRRLTRLTNAFSKSLDNHKAAITLYVAFYNFCRKHQTLGKTPAMAAGLSDHAWTVAELLCQ